MTLIDTDKYSGWVTPAKKRYFLMALVCCVIVLMLYPLESTVVPVWRLRVINVEGKACPIMRVDQDWAHYSLELEPEGGEDRRLTDKDGFVEFPERRIRASLLRRIVVPVIAHISIIVHGSTGASGTVWASGIKDVAWLSYKSGKPLPDKMRVEKCISGVTEQEITP